MRRSKFVRSRKQKKAIAITGFRADNAENSGSDLGHKRGGKCVALNH